MYANGPVGRPLPQFLQAPRLQGGAPASYVPPPPPRPTSIIEGGPAGADIRANLYNFGVMCWNFLKELFTKVRAAVAPHL